MKRGGRRAAVTGIVGRRSNDHEWEASKACFWVWYVVGVGHMMEFEGITVLSGQDYHPFAALLASTRSNKPA